MRRQSPSSSRASAALTRSLQFPDFADAPGLTLGSEGEGDPDLRFGRSLLPVHPADREDRLAILALPRLGTENREAGGRAPFEQAPEEHQHLVGTVIPVGHAEDA